MVIAIIATLIGLLLPAVQNARESARRASCSNNLKQIGLAIHTFESARKVLPAGFTCFLDQPGPSWGWATFILPYIEQTALFDQLDPQTRPLHSVISLTRLVAPADSQLLGTQIPTYRCPSDTTPALNELTTFGDFRANRIRLATSNYVASAGNQPEPAFANVLQAEKTIHNYDSGGAFFGVADPKSNPPGSAPLGLKRSEIGDGVTKTIAAGERGIFNYAAVWAGNGKTSDHGSHHNARTIGRPTFLINRDAAAVFKAEDQGKGYGSRHPGGAQFLFLDGGVDFVSENLASTEMKYLSNRNDGSSFTTR